METVHTLAYDDISTPTRFIRNCEEIGLFQDLQHNPFDETFRIAVETSNHDLPHVLKEPLTKNNLEETLNTPRISLRKDDSFQNVCSILDEDDDMVLPNDYLIESVLPEDSALCSEKENQSNDSSDIEIIEESIGNDFPSGVKTSVSSNVTTYVSTLATSVCQNNIVYTINGNPLQNRNIGGFLIQSISSTASNPTITSVNTNKHVVIQKSSDSNLKMKKNVDESVNKFSTTRVLKTVTTSKASDFLYQLSAAKLPKILSGKNVVILPSNSNIKATEPRNVKTFTKSEHVTNPVAGFDVKQKLKNLLRSSASQIILEDDLKNENTIRQSRESSNSASVDDEKREYSRERNRMAQKRCRMKKKRWIMQLKKETECVLNENQTLQVELSSLRAEIAHLKTLLLAHRNCSVTRAMFKADLSAILGNDISSIAEDIEIPVADSTADDFDQLEDSVCRSVKSVVNHHQQVHQVNQQVNHIHVHVPPTSQFVENKEKRVIQSSSLPRQINLFNSKIHQNKLLFDSKVVPIKPNDRSANNLLVRQIVSPVRSKVLTIRNKRDSDTNGLETKRKCGLEVITDKQTISPMISGSMNETDIEICLN